MEASDGKNVITLADPISPPRTVRDSSKNEAFDPRYDFTLQENLPPHYSNETIDLDGKHMTVVFLHTLIRDFKSGTFYKRFHYEKGSIKAEVNEIELNEKKDVPPLSSLDALAYSKKPRKVLSDKHDSKASKNTYDEYKKLMSKIGDVKLVDETQGSKSVYYELGKLKPNLEEDQTYKEKKALREKAIKYASMVHNRVENDPINASKLKQRLGLIGSYANYSGRRDESEIQRLKAKISRQRIRNFTASIPKPKKSSIEEKKDFEIDQVITNDARSTKDLQSSIEEYQRRLEAVTRLKEGMLNRYE